MKFTLKKFFILTSVLSILAILFPSFYIYEHNKTMQSAELREWLRGITIRNSGILVELSHENVNPAHIEDLLDSTLLTNKAIKSISISMNGSVIDYSTDRKRITERLSKELLDKLPLIEAIGKDDTTAFQKITYYKNGLKYDMYLIIDIKYNYLTNKILSSTLDDAFMIFITVGLMMIILMMLLWFMIAKPLLNLRFIVENIDNSKDNDNNKIVIAEFDILKNSIKESFKKLKHQADELNSLNSALENRVSDELVKSRQKDYLLIQQSKLATMGEMINAIAHQWRQPLNTLALTVQDIKYAYGKNEINEQYVDTLVKDSMGQVKYMSKTIDDFRNFYKPNKEKKLFSLNSATKSSLSLVKARLEAHFFEIVESYDSDLPDINGYENEFKQAILNIIANSQDAADERKIASPKMIIHTGKKDGYAMLTIEDNCGGVASEVMNRIFEPYFTTKEQGKGTGIGLFMTKTIIEENMNGYIEASSLPSGLKIMIRLPVI